MITEASGGRAIHESTLTPGCRIDRYELLYVMARGGMGEVWAARRGGADDLDEIYAIKTILPKYAADPEFRAMFLDEGMITSAIRHPNVVQVLDLGEHDRMLYMVMEWVEGDSLQRIVRNVEAAGGRVPLAITLRILADACPGLHAAHELADRSGRPLDVVHRDVSLGNILVSSTTGVAKLIDFGVAKARNRIAGDTNESVIKGKVRFMAPEQVNGDAVDRRADLWSLGGILYRVATGTLAFSGKTDFEIVAKLLRASRPPPVPSEVPSSVARILERLLDPNPAKRFSTALELQRAIESAAQGLGAEATHADVAEYVRQHTKDEVEQRRRAFDAALSALAHPRDTPPASTGTPSARSPESGPLFVELPSTVAAFASSAPGRPRRGALVFAAFLLVAGALAAAAMLVSRGPRSQATSASPPAALMRDAPDASSISTGGPDASSAGPAASTHSQSPGTKEP